MKTQNDQNAYEHAFDDGKDERVSGTMRTLKVDPSLADSPEIAASLVDALDDILRWEQENDTCAVG